MIIMKIGGGLGNQMFQYALGRSLSAKNSDTLFLDVSEYDNNTDYKYYRPFGLGNFNVQINIATQEDIEKVKYPFKGLIGKLVRKITLAFRYRVLHQRHTKFEPHILDMKGNIYLEGYFQSEKYFRNIREILLKEFTLKKPLSSASLEISDNILKANNSVSLHVRRGDYVADPNNFRIYGNHCDQEYYEKALAILSKNKSGLTVFVFSDDIEWVKMNLRIPYSVNYISEKSAPDYELMMLMSICQSHVIANSTFGWWPAWLDNKEGKVVIAPSVWIPGMDLPIKDIIPSEWICV